MLTNKDYDKMLQFILHIQEDKNDFRQTVLNLLKEIFGYSQMTFYLTDEEGHWSNPMVFNISNDSIATYSKPEFYTTDMFHTVNMPKQMLQKRVVSVTDFMPYEKFVNTEFYNDFLKKYNLHYQIALPLTTGNQLLGIVAIFKPKEAGNFTQKDHLLLNNLNKHIAYNLKTYLDITQIKYEQYLFKNCSFKSPMGLIVLNHKFSLLHHNELAKEYCMEITQSNSVTHSINQVVSSLMSQILNLSFNAEITLNKYTFKIVPFILPTLSGGMESVYAVYITKPIVKASLSYEKIAKDYDLTTREKDILELIVQGLNNNEIADKLFISIHTVKSHVENIFRKMKVSRRTSLLNKINELNKI